MRKALRIAFGSWLALAHLSALTASAQQWGDLKGMFVYQGIAPAPVPLNVTKEPLCAKCKLVDEELVIGPNLGIANIVIYVKTKNVKVHPDYEKTALDKLTYDTVCCRFEPRILTLRLSQTLVLRNVGPVAHNTNIQPILDTPVNPLQLVGGNMEHQFQREQKLPVVVSCNIHPWMRGYILPRANPYAAVTDLNGSFVMKNLPVGPLEFVVWHERCGYLNAKNTWFKGSFTLNIQPGENKLDGQTETIPVPAAKL